MSKVKIDPEKLAAGVRRLSSEHRREQWYAPLRRVKGDLQTEYPENPDPGPMTIEHASVSLAFPEGVDAIIELSDMYRVQYASIALSQHLGRVFAARLVEALGSAARRLRAENATLQGDRYNVLTQIVAEEAGVVFSNADAEHLAMVMSALDGTAIAPETVMKSALITFNGAARLHPVTRDGYNWQGLTAVRTDEGIVFNAVPVTFYND